MSTTEKYQEALAARTEVLQAIYSLIQEPLGEAKGRLRAGPKLNSLLIHLGLELEKLRVLSQEVACRNHVAIRSPNENKPFQPDDYLEEALSQQWTAFWTRLHSHFPESTISGPSQDLSDKLLSCSRCSEKSNSSVIWSCCGHLYCESCYLEKVPKCDNCGKKSKRHSEDCEGVELELDGDGDGDDGKSLGLSSKPSQQARQ